MYYFAVRILVSSDSMVRATSEAEIRKVSAPDCRTGASDAKSGLMSYGIEADESVEEDPVNCMRASESVETKS